MKDVQTELRIERGEIRHIDLLMTPLRDRQGGHNGRLLVLREISQLKQIEAELRDANERLREQLAENETLHAKLQEQAIRDPLTGLYNRRFMEETLERELAQARRAAGTLSVAIVDLDHFKAVNDAQGHAAGDRLIQSLAELLQRNSRAGDAICRYGGEEFVAVLPGAAADAARARVDQWRRESARLRIDAACSEIGTTLSAGVATFPTHGTSGDTLLEAADLALYAAKAAGRDQVQVVSLARAATAPDPAG